MKTASILVRATWDGDARVWVATSTDIDGLAVEAETHEALTEKVVAAIADLIELNGIDSDLPEIPVRVLSEDLRRVVNPHCRVMGGYYRQLVRLLRDHGCTFVRQSGGDNEI